MAFLFLGVLLYGCSRRPPKSQSQIVGTWIPSKRATNDALSAELIFSSDGSYSSKMRWTASHSNVFNGQWQIEGDILTVTLTNVTGNEPHDSVGHVMHIKINRLDDNEFDYEISGDQLGAQEPLVIHLKRENQ